MDHSAVTQPTQLDDPFDGYPDFDDTDTWGMLLPADPSNHHLPPRIFFLNTQPTYRIGRAHDNDVQFNFGKMISQLEHISQLHCILICACDLQAVTTAPSS